MGPSTLPASLPQSFSLMVPVMCRKLQMQARYSHSIEGVDVTRYTVDKDSMKQDKCYCPQPEVTPCLPDGYLHLEPCYPDISPPMAVSFPHGLYSPAPRMLTHTPKPDPSKHEIYMDVNRELGVPMGVHVSFQLSALLQPDPAFPLLENVNWTNWFHCSGQQRASQLQLLGWSQPPIWPCHFHHLAPRGFPLVSCSWEVSLLSSHLPWVSLRGGEANQERF